MGVGEEEMSMLRLHVLHHDRLYHHCPWRRSSFDNRSKTADDTNDIQFHSTIHFKRSPLPFNWWQQNLSTAFKQ